MDKKNQWGLFFFLSAVLLCGAGIAIAGAFPYTPRNELLYKTILPVTGVIFSITAFFTGHFSYPRVSNFKVYLLGYLTGLFGVAYFLFSKYYHLLPPRLPDAPEGFLPALYVLMFVNSIILLLVPSIAKYRTVRQITLVVITVESVLVLTGRFSEQATHWAYALFHGTIPGFEAFLAALFGVLVFGEVVWLSLWRVSKEFYLGGLLAGWALFISAAWFWRFIVHNVNFYHINPIETALFSIMPLYCTAGVLTHWFLRMEHRISYDPLLHIYNRDYCSKIISEQSNLDTAPPFSVAMVDIDHFKNVNDTYGHQAGDQVLYAVAQAIQREVVPDGTVCRYGGEEMIIFFPQRTTKDVEHCVENVRVAIEKMKTKTRKKPLSVTVSCGISTREDLSQSIIDVIHSADKALYRAKNDGRNQVRTSKTPLEQSKKK